MLALGETAVLGAFCAQDLALFVLFFDLMLIPFYFLIGIWGGGADRVRATTKFVIYTLVGLLLMLAAAVATGILATPDGGADLVRARGRSRSAARRGLAGLDLPAASRRVPRQDAGLPAARLDARRLPRGADSGAGRAAPASSRRSAPTASCGSCCRSSRTPSGTSRSCCW